MVQGELKRIMKSKLQTTIDGSHTLYVPQIDECYHSTNGAMQESMHIFIRAGLQQQGALDEITVFEVGFGTGLNALLTLLDARKREVKVNYVAVELYPVSQEVVMELNYAEMARTHYPDCTDADFEGLHAAAWNEPVQISPTFTLTKWHADLKDLDLGIEQYDVVYFDAFSPEKQGEMWVQSNFERLYAACCKGAVLTTYCAKGVIRRTLLGVGFEVDRLPGPPGKREILRGRKR